MLGTPAESRPNHACKSETILEPKRKKLKQKSDKIVDALIKNPSPRQKVKTYGNIPSRTN